MEDYNLRLILKSELKIQMPSHIFKEIAKDAEIYDERFSKDELIELMFKKYSLHQMKNLILNKYTSLEASRNYKKLMDKLNRISLDEKNAQERKENRYKRSSGFRSPCTDHNYWDPSGFEESNFSLRDYILSSACYEYKED